MPVILPLVKFCRFLNSVHFEKVSPYGYKISINNLIIQVRFLGLHVNRLFASSQARLQLLQQIGGFFALLFHLPNGGSLTFIFLLNDLQQLFRVFVFVA